MVFILNQSSLVIGAHPPQFNMCFWTQQAFAILNSVVFNQTWGTRCLKTYNESDVSCANIIRLSSCTGQVLIIADLKKIVLPK